MYNHLTALASVKADSVLASAPFAQDFQQQAESQKGFFDSSLGGILKTVLGALGILLVIFAILRGIGAVAKGDIGKAVKGVAGAVLFAVFMFQPEMIADLVGAIGGAVGAAIDTVGELGSG